MTDATAHLLTRIRQCGLPEPALEYRFDARRRWRFDFAWPQHMLAVEIDGGVWVRGRHVRGFGFERDCEKLNAAALAGWRVLRFTPAMVARDDAISALCAAFGAYTPPTM